MALRLFNTLSRTLEDFEPLEPGKVRVYGCGPTIYDLPHVGNYRSFLVYDLLHRYLEWSGYDVRFVTNLTDVDDRTIKGALERGVSIQEYTAPFGEAFLDGTRTLGIRPFDAYPRATEYVEAMTRFVKRLEDKGLAYQADDGSVFFPISSFAEYGKLSRIDPDAVRPGTRVATDDYGKEDARDFALWKAAKEEDEEAGAAWDSPWGRGRPGWHLECSVMSISELGETLDIHLGGEDLIFPHHEDEIAQSEGATGKPFVRYWLHVKHLLLEGQKMSKSLGNTVTVEELINRGYDSAAIRHHLLSAQYRRELNFTMDGLDGSTRAVQRLLDFEARLHNLT
ncbi:cysteine--tRNA ligase, partial [Gemmatimonadota bacterium]